MSTKSFIINLPIITGDQDRRRLRKSFSFGCNLQNAVMGGGWDRVLQMRATAECRPQGPCRKAEKEPRLSAIFACGSA